MEKQTYVPETSEKRETMTRRITFIHTADLHLDSPFTGLEHLPESIFKRIQESTFTAFERVIELAAKEKVDFILIAGDLYDDEDRSLKAQLRLKKQFERLNEEGIQVFIIFGNHDHTGGNWVHIQWPENVHIFSDRDVECIPFVRDGKVLANIYGYSYPTRSVTENIVYKFQKRSEAPLHIGLLHGTASGTEGHEPYCPFTIQNLLEKDFDYWALGHIHKRQILHRSDPPIIYPGNIQGRHKKETGEKGVYLVELAEGGKSAYRFVPVFDILWNEIKLSVNEIAAVSELYDHIRAVKEQQRRNGSALLTIMLDGASSLFWDLMDQDHLDELAQILNEEEEGKNEFVWIVSIQHQIVPSDDFFSSSYISKDFEQILDHFHQFDEAMGPLYKNRLFRRFFQSFTENEKEELIKEAKTMIYYELFKQEWKRS